MRVLLDTHALLWAYLADPRLSAAAAAAITRPANRVFVSAASHWEIAIKVSTGKLALRDSVLDFVQFAILDQGFTLLPVGPRWPHSRTHPSTATRSTGCSSPRP